MLEVEQSEAFFFKESEPKKTKTEPRESLLFSAIKKSPHTDLPPDNVVKGICSFLVQKELVPVRIESIVPNVLDFLTKFNLLTGGIDFYKSNAFKYLYEGTSISELSSQILDNSKFWIDIFGRDFFSRHRTDYSERGELMESQIDNDFYLSCKAGSGVGTFSVDFAIGMIKPGKNILFKTRTSGELWRTTIDTENANAGKSLRIIRTGSAIKSSHLDYEKKIQMYDLFKERYRISPQRALAFLTMYIGKDLNVKEVKAISLEGASQKRLHLIRGSRVNFDYDFLFKSVGFSLSPNKNWLTMGNPSNNFYSTIQTSPSDQNGLRAHETSGLNKVLEAFQMMKDTMGRSYPITVCATDSSDELEKAFATFRTIHNRG